MFTISTHLGQSLISGIGVFASEYVSQGTVLWELIPEFDLVIPKACLVSFPPMAQQALRHYGFLDAETDNIILCGDDARFTNHSFDPNAEALGLEQAIALLPIEAGDEITENYFSFDAWATEKIHENI